MRRRLGCSWRCREGGGSGFGAWRGRVEGADLVEHPGTGVVVEAVGAGVGEGDGLAVVLGRHLAVSASLADKRAALEPVDLVGVEAFEFEASRLCLVEPPLGDELGNAVGEAVEFVELGDEVLGRDGFGAQALALTLGGLMGRQAAALVLGLSA